MTAAETERAEAVVATKTAETLDERSVYVSLTLSAVGIRRRVATEDVTGQTNGETATDAPENQMLHVAKDIFDADELKAVRKAQRDIYVWLFVRGYRSAQRGYHRLPLSFVEPMVKYFDEKETEVAEHVEHLIGRYPEIKENAKRRLGKLYAEADYPSASELRAAFKTDWHFMAPAVPGQLTSISRSLYEREAAKAAQRAEEEREMIVAALRQQFAELVQHMAAILESGVDGKAKRFRESSLENAREFLGLFDAKNIGGDQQLPQLVARAKQLLEGVDTEQLKSDKDLRDRIKEGFAQVKEAMAGMVTLKASRAVKLQD